MVFRFLYLITSSLLTRLFLLFWLLLKQPFSSLSLFLKLFAMLSLGLFPWIPSIQLQLRSGLLNWSWILRNLIWLPLKGWCFGCLRGGGGWEFCSELHMVGGLFCCYLVLWLVSDPWGRGLGLGMMRFAWELVFNSIIFFHIDYGNWEWI